MPSCQPIPPTQNSGCTFCEIQNLHNESLELSPNINYPDQRCPAPRVPLAEVHPDNWAYWSQIFVNIENVPSCLPTGYIGVRWLGTFKMYSAFDHWAYWSHILTVISMFSPCTQWVFGLLFPVLLGGANVRRICGMPACALVLYELRYLGISLK